jgi:hypothetical protein
MKIRVIGIYPVEQAPESCHLLEFPVEDFQENRVKGRNVAGFHTLI